MKKRKPFLLPALVVLFVVIGAGGWVAMKDGLFDDFRMSESAAARLVYGIKQSLKPGDVPYRDLPQKYLDRMHIVMIRPEFEYGGERHVFEMAPECITRCHTFPISRPELQSVQRIIRSQGA